MGSALAKISPKKALGYLQPLNRDVNPNLAAFLGLAFGGIGLGIFFLSFIDAIIPLAVAIALTLGFKELASADPTTGFIAGCLLASIYGYLRASDSNARRHGVAETEPQPGQPAAT